MVRVTQIINGGRTASEIGESAFESKIGVGMNLLPVLLVPASLAEILLVAFCYVRQRTGVSHEALSWRYVLNTSGRNETH